MSDEFDDIIAGEFTADFGHAASAGVLGPDEADDHMALHVLEAALQVAAMLDCFDYAGERVTEPIFPIVAEFGLSEWIGAAFPDGRLDPEAPNFAAWMLSVRSIAGDLSVALESFLRDHDLPGVTFMVHLSSHGWYPMHIPGTVKRHVG